MTAGSEQAPARLVTDPLQLAADLPLSEEEASYVLARAGAKVGTMSRRLSAIRFAHQMHNRPDPTTGARVVAVWEGIRRTHGAPPDHATPLMPPELLDVLAACPHTRTWKTPGRATEPDLAGLRDRALLLVGFFAALRRSELAALTVDQVTEHPNGLVLGLPRSKTNRDGALDVLRGQLRGQVVVSPSPSGVPNTRDVFNAMHTGRPAVIAQCSGTADVVDAVNFAREHDLAVAVRGGGHSVAGLSTIDGGLLIDLSAMRGVQVDPEQRLAQVQGGAVLGDLDRETQAFGLATPVGVISDTGVGGLTLGGGYGNLRRKYGLSCDTGLADEPMRAGVDNALGRNLHRLAEIKAIYDPQNFFRYNNNILPAGR